MATLIPQSDALNLEKSINAYLSVSLPGVDIKYMRQPLGFGGDEWIEVNQFELLAPQILTRTQHGTGGDAQWQVDINCLIQNTHLSTNLFELPLLARRVKNLFAVHVAIPINDYDAVGEPQVGNFSLVGLSSFNIPVEPEMRRDQVTVSATLGYDYAALV